MKIITKIKRKLKLNYFLRESSDLTEEQKKILIAWDSLSQPRSCLFFTTHKCASVFVDKLLNSITKNSNYKVINYATAIHNLGPILDIGDFYTYKLFLEKAYDELYQIRGKIYGPERKPLEFPGREKFKHIFFLRDPRDVLVSAYYSFGYSHGVPKGKKQQQRFYELREKIQKQGIDDYACDAAINWLLPIYQEYKQLLETSDYYLYLTYDEFKDDTNNFLKKIMNFLEIEISERDKQKIVDEASPVQNYENMTQHKRSGKSQQYLKELNSDTIQYLNEIFAEVLSYWKFDI